MGMIHPFTPAYEFKKIDPWISAPERLPSEECSKRTLAMLKLDICFSNIDGA